MVRFVYYGEDMTDYPSNAEMFELLDKLEEETEGS
jgi:hypothetical protein